MKRITVILLFSIISMAAAAQSFPLNVGIRGGWNDTKIKVKDMKIESHGGYMFGAFARLNLGKLYIEPGLNFSNKQSYNKTYDSKLKYRSVDVPIMLGYYFIKAPIFKLRGFAGPVASFTTKNIDKDLFKNADKTMWNGKVGGGIDLWKITLDLDYEFGFRKFGDGAKAPQSWNLTIGFKII